MSTASHGISIENLLRHREWVRGVSRALVFGDQDVDDLEQETWLASLSAPAGPVTSPRGWLATVLRRTASRLGSRDVKRRDLEKLIPRGGEAAPTADVVARAELQERVAQSVLRLEEPYRETLLLRFFEDLPVKAIAGRMHAPLETVRTRLRRGLAMLRSEFEAKKPGAWRLALLPLAGVPGLKAGGAVAAGVLIMSKTQSLALVGIAAVLSVIVWFAASGRIWSADESSETAPSAIRAPLPEERREGGIDRAIAEGRDAVRIQPMPSRDEGEPTPASSRSSAGSAISANHATVEGEVLSPEGQPVEGATVLAGDPAKDGALSDEQSIRDNLANLLEAAVTHARGTLQQATTSAAGGFSFDKIMPTGRLTVAASHPELGIVAAAGLPAKPGEKQFVTLRFEAGMRFHGRVTTPAELRPVASARIEVSGFRGPRSDGVRSPRVTSDQDGNYRTAGLPGTMFHVSVDAAGYYSAHKWVKDLAPAERSRQVDFTLEAAPLLRGKFLLADGSPARLSDHLLALFGQAGPQDPRQGLALFVAFDDPRKDPNFRTSGRSSGRVLEESDAYELTPESKGIKFLSLWLGPDLLGLAELKAHDVAPDIIVDWSKGRRPRGRGVVSLIVKSAETSLPVTTYSAHINGPADAERLERNAWGHRVKAADGRFRFNPMTEGKYDLAITAEGYAAKKTTVEIAPDPQANEIIVELIPESKSPAKATVAGVVRGPSGAPFNGATVWLVPEKPDRSADVVRAQTNSEGAFRFEKMLPDAYVVIAESGRLAPAWVRAVAQPSADELVLTLSEGVEVRVTPEGSPGPFSLRVLDPAGVAVLDDVRSGTQRFGASFPVALTPARYRLELICPNFETARAEFVAARDAVVRVAMTRSAK